MLVRDLPQRVARLHGVEKRLLRHSALWRGRHARGCGARRGLAGGHDGRSLRHVRQIGAAVPQCGPLLLPGGAPRPENEHRDRWRCRQKDIGFPHSGRILDPHDQLPKRILLNRSRWAMDSTSQQSRMGWPARCQAECAACLLFPPDARTSSRHTPRRSGFP